MPNGEFSLVFKQNGNVEGVYHDALPAFYPHNGAKTVRRASNVEFDDSRSVWVAKLLDGTEIASGPHRGTVIAEEVRIINEMILQNKEVPSE